MIDRQKLLSDLQSLLRTVEVDLRARSEDAELPEVSGWLKAEYEAAKKAGRTAQTLKSWIDDFVTQVAAAWVLSCVFVRFLEDNSLVDPPRIAGPASDSGGGQSRLKRARDEYDHWVQNNRGQTDREYLLDIFEGLAALPAAGEVFGSHNPLNALPNWLSGDAAQAILAFFQKVDADTGEITHDFTDASGDTRFLGDLYQDLSEAARKKYALLQTPDFVEAFILDRTLEPALDEFGLEPVSPFTLKTSHFRLIDPACGSGHFLLGSFPRILARWLKKEPGEKIRVLVQRALDSIHGVDVNPYAIAIARFRLLLAALAACDCKKLKDAPKFKIHLACGDSLWHAPLRGDTGGRVGRGQLEFEALSPEAAAFQDEAGDADLHAYFAEDARALRELLTEGLYHCVVANPPYIVPKDRALNQDYRQRYASCHMKYSLAVPFMERIFRLAVGIRESGVGSENTQASGYTGQITANSFMKREFGKKLIEEYLPTIDLTHVIDTSGAYIPGHGTPTTILFGRHRPPVAPTIRTVMGIKGEPSTPDDPAAGLVWTAIVDQIDQPGSESDFVSAGDSERERFGSHPWSIGGGGAAELKEQLDEAAVTTLSELVESIGVTCFTLEDDIFILPLRVARRFEIAKQDLREMVVGDAIKEWSCKKNDFCIFPYDNSMKPISDDPNRDSLKYLWLARTHLANNKMFAGKTKVECGLKWYEFGRLTASKLRSKYSIVYAFVATHNQFAMIDGTLLSKNSAPVIKLEGNASKQEHLRFLGILNSSLAGFWIRQNAADKGMSGGIVEEQFERFFMLNATTLGRFPVTEDSMRLVETANQMFECAQQLEVVRPCEVLSRGGPVVDGLKKASMSTDKIRGEMVRLQEDLDWQCYQLYGLTDEEIADPCSSIANPEADIERPEFVIKPGQRAFEIVLARKMAAGNAQTTWFERHGTTPITELPEHWPEDYKALVNRRIEIIESDPNIALIEQPEYKRRWNTESWESQVERALQTWLLDRLESYFDYDGRMNDEGTPTAKLETELVSIARLADIAASDEAFMEVAAVYRDDPAFNVPKLVEELVQGEHVPLLPILRYKPAGLRKREQWQETWELQREEDRINEQRSALTARINERHEKYKLGSETTQSQLRIQLEALLSTCQSINKTQPETIAFNEGDDVEAYCEKVLSKGFDGKYAALAMLVNDHRKAIKETKKQQSLEYQAACIADEELQSWERERKDLPPTPEIPVPPKYKSSDFISTGGARYWALRGKLDVPKERWISFPHCPGSDGTLMICWAGYDHLQQALAISTHYQAIKEDQGGDEDVRLIPLLACIAELIPWLRQWHNEPNADFGGLSMADYFENEFLATEARALNQTIEEIKAWQPPVRTTRRRSTTS